jgi:hypothetical protein
MIIVRRKSMESQGVLGGIRYRGNKQPFLWSGKVQKEQLVVNSIALYQVHLAPNDQNCCAW